MSFILLGSAVIEAKPFYEGKIIRIIVATKPGGGYDYYARLMAPFIQKYLPGSTVIVKNMPGAGHVIGTNATYLAKPDGLTIGTFNRAVGMTQVAGMKGVKFDFSKFKWLGSPSEEIYCLIVNSETFKNIDDVLKSRQFKNGNIRCRNRRLCNNHPFLSDAGTKELFYWNRVRRW